MGADCLPCQLYCRLGFRGIEPKDEDDEIEMKLDLEVMICAGNKSHTIPGYICNVITVYVALRGIATQRRRSLATARIITASSHD